MNYCEYGCGKESLYILKNGKKCCSKFCTQCVSIRNRNSRSLIKRHQEKKLKGFTEEDRKKKQGSYLRKIYKK
jgi:hypothetical protein